MSKTMKITENERDAVYKTIFSRRDVRSDFTKQEVKDDVIKRILTAAHHAPSVGFMQPWDFIVVSDLEAKKKIKQGFEESNVKSKKMFNEEQQQKYQQFKLEGILEAPLGICVTCDRSRNGPVVLGKTIKDEMDLYSSVCAVQNLWLAARAENLGLGWVSIIEDDILRSALGIPENIEIIAYLCIGYVSKFKDKPELESAGWLSRRSVDKAIHYNKWSTENI
jgi:5,6-dimethylbenzimidazole synthase